MHSRRARLAKKLRGGDQRRGHVGLACTTGSGLECQLSSEQPAVRLVQRVHCVQRHARARGGAQYHGQGRGRLHAARQCSWRPSACSHVHGRALRWLGATHGAPQARKLSLRLDGHDGCLVCPARVGMPFVCRLPVASFAQPDFCFEKAKVDKFEAHVRLLMRAHTGSTHKTHLLVPK